MGLSNKIRQNPRAKIKWPVKVGPSNGRMVGETIDVSPNGVFISCQSPLKLNETFEMTLEVPELGYPLKASAEVVWSNIYGPDDKITPRGMGVRFLAISDEDRTVISNEVRHYLKLKEVEADADTPAIDAEHVGS